MNTRHLGAVLLYAASAAAIVGGVAIIARGPETPPVQPPAVDTPTPSTASGPQRTLTAEQRDRLLGVRLRPMPALPTAPPEPTVAPASEPPPPAPKLRLIGTMLERGRSQALVETGPGDIRRVGPGDKIDDIIVLAIERDSITVRRNGREHTITFPDPNTPHPSHRPSRRNQTRPQA